MVEGREHPCLALETGEATGPRRTPRENLDRDIAPQRHVVRAVDLAHAAYAEKRTNLVGADSPANQRVMLNLSVTARWNLARFSDGDSGNLTPDNPILVNLRNGEARV